MILVLGGTGKVGIATVRSLVAEGASVRVLSRRPAEARVPAGVEIVGGDLAEPASLETAFADVERMAMIPPLHPREEELNLLTLRTAAETGMDRVVFLSVFGLEELPDAVHLAAKRSAERELVRLGLPGAVVRPNGYFQNDLGVWSAITNGSYPVPFGEVGCHPVDTRDVGEAIARLLVGEDRSGETIPVVGAEAFTGSSVAAMWSRVLGREVRYAATDLDEWATGMMREGYPDWLVEALATMYRAVVERGGLATRDEIARSTELLGREPRRYEDFARELAEGSPVL